VSGSIGSPLTRPLYLLDGQQRLTSLHRVFEGHDGAFVVFNVTTERFQMQSAATKKDPRWIPVHEILDGTVRANALTRLLQEREIEVDPDEIEDRLIKVRDIAKYEYHMEVLEGLPYEEVSQIFVRVNSKGRSLRTVDLALATLSAKWPGVVDKIDAEAERWKKGGYPALDAAFLVRTLAALSTPTRSLRSLPQASIEDLERGWAQAKKGLAHLVQLLKQNADMATSDLLPSVNALVPLVVFLGARQDKPLPAEDANALIYWMFAAFIRGRYNQSADTVIGQDALAARSDDPIHALYQNLNLIDQPIEITEQALVGRTVGSPYFFFSYLAARSETARDWFFGTNICTDGEGAFKLEYHHVHPQSLLRSAGYAKTEINDLANLAFISARANQRISNRAPNKYFPEVGIDDLSRHFVPIEEDVREIDQFRGFTVARRQLLAEAMNKLLDRFRPGYLDASNAAEGDPSAGEQLSIGLYGGSDGALVFQAKAAGSNWHATIPFDEFTRFLEEVRDGLTAGIEIDDEVVEVQAGSERIELPMGPLIVTGTLEEWDAMIERELSDILPGDPATSTESTIFIGERLPFPISDSD
jgi:hypothetical protein